MNLRHLAYGALALFFQPLAGCGDAPAEDDAPSVETPGAPSADASADAAYDHLIVAFGDSLYAGYGLAQGEGFAPELERALAAEGLAVRVVNAGVSGDTSQAGRQRLAFTLDGLDRAPDLVIVGLGGNDMLRGLSPEETRANLAAILEELDRRGIAAALTGMVAAPNLGPDYADAFNPIFADLAREYDVPLYPFFLDGVIQRPELMLPDGIHPNAEGIDIVVERLAPIVAEAIES